MDSKIIQAYKQVLESHTPQHVDEDEEFGKTEILKDIATGLKGILESIEKYLSKDRSTKTISLPDNPEDTSWIPSTK